MLELFLIWCFSRVECVIWKWYVSVFTDCCGTSEITGKGEKYAQVASIGFKVFCKLHKNCFPISTHLKQRLSNGSKNHFFTYKRSWWFKCEDNRYGEGAALHSYSSTASSWLILRCLTWIWLPMSTSFAAGRRALLLTALFSLHYGTFMWPFFCICVLPAEEGVTGVISELQGLRTAVTTIFKEAFWGWFKLET